MENMTELKVIMSEATQKIIRTIINAISASILLSGILLFVLAFTVFGEDVFWFDFGIGMGTVSITFVPVCYIFKRVLVNRIKKTEMVVTERGVYAYYVRKDGIVKKTFDLPIEQIQEVSFTEGLPSQSKGRTIRMQTVNRKFYITYVLNAEEVMAFLDRAIKKAKGLPYEPDESSYEEQDIRPQRSQSDVADSLKAIADLRDAGIITEEEFEQKKKEILGKM